jgi:hypothetical protein
VGPGVGIHAQTRVGDDQRDVGAGRERRKAGGCRLVDLDVAGLERQLAAFGHGVARVYGEVHDDLLQLAEVHLHASDAVAQPGHQRDVLPDQSPQHVLHLRHDAVEVQHLRLEDLLPAEGEQLAGEGGGALRRPHDLLDLRADRGVPEGLLQDRLAAADDDPEDVVEVVGDSARQPPHCLRLLGLAELLLQRAHLRDVADRGRYQSSLVGNQRAQADLDRELAAVPAQPVEIEPRSTRRRRLHP